MNLARQRNSTRIFRRLLAARNHQAESVLSRSSSSLIGDDESLGFGQSSEKTGSVHSAVVPAVDEKDRHQRVWLPNSAQEPLFWSEDVVKNNERNPHNLAMLLERIERQELEGGRFRLRQFGVLHEDPHTDMRLLSENYTVPSLASALRDREDALQYCAQLAAENKFEALKDYLHNFHPSLVLERRNEMRRLNVRKPLNSTSLETIRKALMRMPRRVTQAHSKRAGVVIAICHVNGVPSVLLERRAASLRAHPDEGKILKFVRFSFKFTFYCYLRRVILLVQSVYRGVWFALLQIKRSSKRAYEKCRKKLKA